MAPTRKIASKPLALPIKNAQPQPNGINTNQTRGGFGDPLQGKPNVPNPRGGPGTGIVNLPQVGGQAPNAPKPMYPGSGGIIAQVPDALQPQHPFNLPAPTVPNDIVKPPRPVFGQPSGEIVPQTNAPETGIVPQAPAVAGGPPQPNMPFTAPGGQTVPPSLPSDPGAGKPNVQPGLPPRLQAAIDAGRLTPEQAQVRNDQFNAGQLPGQQNLKNMAQTYQSATGNLPPNLKQDQIQRLGLGGKKQRINDILYQNQGGPQGSNQYLNTMLGGK